MPRHSSFSAATGSSVKMSMLSTVRWSNAWRVGDLMGGTMPASLEGSGGGGGISEGLSFPVVS